MAKIVAKSEVMGLVAQIESKVGDRIAAGDTVMFIESMKMQIPVMVRGHGHAARNPRQGGRCGVGRPGGGDPRGVGGLWSALECARERPTEDTTQGRGLGG